MDDRADLARIAQLAKQRSSAALAELAALSKLASPKARKAAKIALEAAAPAIARKLAVAIPAAVPDKDASLSERLRELERAKFPAVPVFAEVLARRGVPALSYACEVGGEMCKRVLARQIVDGKLELRFVTTPLPAELAALPITSLDLTRCRLVDIPACVLAMPRLAELDLSYNRIRRFGPEVARMKALTRLFFMDLPLATLENLDAIPKLRSLEVYRARITTVPDSFATSKLETLRIVQCHHITQTPPAITRMRSLRVLELAQCERLTAIDPGVFELSKLEYLDLTGARLGDVPPAIGKLENLRELQLRAAGVTSLPAELARCKKLHTIDLVLNPGLALAGLAAIYELPALRRLRIKDTGIARSAWRAIRRKLPRVELYE